MTVIFLVVKKQNSIQCFPMKGLSLVLGLLIYDRFLLKSKHETDLFGNSGVSWIPPPHEALEILGGEAVLVSGGWDRLPTGLWEVSSACCLPPQRAMPPV